MPKFFDAQEESRSCVNGLAMVTKMLSYEDKTRAEGVDNAEEGKEARRAMAQQAHSFRASPPNPTFSPTFPPFFIGQSGVEDVEGKNATPSKCSGLIG